MKKKKLTPKKRVLVKFPDAFCSNPCKGVFRIWEWPCEQGGACLGGAGSPVKAWADAVWRISRRKP